MFLLGAVLKRALSGRVLLMNVLWVSSLFSGSINAQPTVSASIQPLQLIAAALTDGISTPSLLLGKGQDPHHPSLKPSQRQAMADADILLWVGPNLEGSLEKVIVSLEAQVLTLIKLDGLQTHLLRGGVDPHLWLNTYNAGVIAEALSQQLIQLDSKNAERYQSNLEDFQTGLLALNTAIMASLSQHNKKPYAVYHNAFQYYEQQFGLQHVVSFTDDEELKPGIRQLLAIRETLEENQVACLLVEPEVNVDELSNVVPLANYVTVDVLGADFSPSKTAYVDFMQALTNTMLECLR